VVGGSARVAIDSLQPLAIQDAARREPNLRQRDCPQQRIKVMKIYLRAAIATFLAVLLALPVGWCCLPVSATAAVKVSAKTAPTKSCCQHAAPQKSPPGQGPVQECRCCKDSPRANDTVTPRLDAAIVALPGFLEISDSPASSVATAGFACPEGPRLHVLQCVWLC